MQVIKRDGRVVDYDGSKVVKAIQKAMIEVEGFVGIKCSESIEEVVRSKFDSVNQLHVEDIQDIVELELMENHKPVAKAYILYRDERNKVRNRKWEMTELQRSIYEMKYQNENESFDNFINRVSGGKKEVAEVIRAKDFLFGGRILASRGVEGVRATYSNCYVLPQPEDNLESIFDRSKEMARTFSLGGGVGLDLSLLRPKGSPVNNMAKTTSGAVSFLDLYDTTTGIIGQHNRRGALMVSMMYDHPDILEFIDVKSDLDAINHANLSIRTRGELFNNPKYSKVLDKMAESNWNMGEPGILNWDRVEDWHLLSHHPEYLMTSTNPCQPLGEYIMTSEGFRKIEDIKDHVFLNGRKYLSTEMFKTGRRSVFKVTLKNGIEVKMTENHKILTSRGDIELEDLKVGDKVRVDHTGIDGYNGTIQDRSAYDRGILLGALLSEGSVVTDELIEFNLHKNGGEGILLVEDIIKTYYDDFRLDLTSIGDRFIGSITNQAYVRHILADLGVDDYIIDNLDLHTLDKDTKLGFLRAIFTFNGRAINSEESNLYSTNSKMLKTIQRLLIEFGIYSLYELHESESSNLNLDGTVTIFDAIYKLRIHDVNFREIGYLTHSENEIVNELHEDNMPKIEDERKEVEISSIEFDNEEDVYSITVSDIHHYSTGGLITHNCGEQPLPDWGSCILASINLGNFILDPYTDKARVDIDRLSKVVRIGIRALNDILDEGLDRHPLEEQTLVVEKFRQIGLGIMNLGGMFIKLGVRYGSDESIEVSEMLGKQILHTAIDESVNLAKIDGSYPAYDFEYIKKSNFFKSLDEGLQNKIKTYGMRNSHVLSIAPTGSISTLIGCSSGGIEPLFDIRHTRTTKSLGQGDKDYIIEDATVLELREEQNIRFEDLPDYVTVSHEIDPIDRIRVQSAWQKYIDSAISSTINLKEETTVEEIKDIYRSAYEYGLKGITVFRDGCKRLGILNTTENNEEYEDEECST